MEFKLFWRRHAAEFYERYFSKSSTSTSKPIDLTTELRRVDKRGLLTKFSTVFRLSLFYSQHDSGNAEDALNTLNDLGFLPKLRSEVDDVAMVIKNALGDHAVLLLDQILVLAMSSVVALYQASSASSSSGSVSSKSGLVSTNAIRSQQLRDIGGLLLILSNSKALEKSFANANETRARLASMQESLN